MKKIIGLIEEITVIGAKKIKCQAKFDTGAYKTSIDIGLAKKLKLKDTGKKSLVKSASIPKGIKRPLVNVSFKILGKEIKTTANVADRSHSKQKVLIGRCDIFNNFIVDVEKNNKSPRVDDLK